MTKGGRTFWPPRVKYIRPDMLLFASVSSCALDLSVVLICSTSALLCGGALSGAAPGVTLLTRASRCKSRRRQLSGPSPNRRVPMISFFLFFFFPYPLLFFFFSAGMWCQRFAAPHRTREPSGPAARSSTFPLLFVHSFPMNLAVPPISLPLPDRCCLALKCARSLGDLLYHYSPTSLFCNCLRTFRHFFSLSTNRRRP